MESRSFDVLWLMFLELEVYEFFFKSECSVGQVLFKDIRIGSLNECDNFSHYVLMVQKSWTTGP